MIFFFSPSLWHLVEADIETHSVDFFLRSYLSIRTGMMHHRTNLADSSASSSSQCSQPMDFSHRKVNTSLATAARKLDGTCRGTILTAMNQFLRQEGVLPTADAGGSALSSNIVEHQGIVLEGAKLQKSSSLLSSSACSAHSSSDPVPMISPLSFFDVLDNLSHQKTADIAKGLFSMLHQLATATSTAVTSPLKKNPGRSPVMALFEVSAPQISGTMHDIRLPSAMAFSTASAVISQSISQISGHADVDEDGVGMIANFEVVAELGRGSFGVVSLGIDSDGSTYAIKSLQWGRSSSSPGSNINLRDHLKSSATTSTTHSSLCSTGNTKWNAIQSEIALLKKIRHDNCVRLHAVIEDKVHSQYHIVMQYVENGPLTKMRDDGTCNALPLTDALNYMTQVSTGLDYLHRHNIIHRDIKPENILIGKNKKAYVADFGVSGVVQEMKATRNIQRAGTMAFQSPELIECQTAAADYGKESDVWAFGVTLYTVLVGKLPFQGWNMPSMVRSILTAEVEFPVEAGIPQDLQHVVRQLLHRDPFKRMTLAEFRHHPVVRKHTGRQDPLELSSLHEEAMQYFCQGSSTGTVAFAQSTVTDSIGMSTLELPSTTAFPNAGSGTGDLLEHEPSYGCDDDAPFQCLTAPQQRSKMGSDATATTNNLNPQAEGGGGDTTTTTTSTADVFATLTSAPSSRPSTPVDMSLTEDEVASATQQCAVIFHRHHNPPLSRESSSMVRGFVSRFRHNFSASSSSGNIKSL